MYHNFDGLAYRWRHNTFSAINMPDDISQSGLLGVDEQIGLLEANLERFLSGKPALNILLWGEKGAGKSTIVRSWVANHAQRGLRVIEFCDDDYYSIYTLYGIFREHRDKYFVLYFDDVSFDDSDDKYRYFKSIVEGGLETKPDNTIFTATSNRRHIIGEKASDTEDIYDRDRHNEATSLFARFGLTLGFYPISKELYLDIVRHYFTLEGLPFFDGWERDAENFAIGHGGRSGRTAWQFTIYTQIIRTIK